MRFLLVVHRYYPYPGGSEYNVKRIAEELVRQGHDVTVLTDVHQGDQNGVKVSSDRKLAFETWDMIFVHGSCPTQDFIHTNGANIKSPIYYLLVQPSDHPVALEGMKNATWIGCGTSFDFTHADKHGMRGKARKFVYGIENHMGNEGFKERYGITTKRMYLSVGGYWPHKRMTELAEVFRTANPTDTTLVLMGYDTQHGPVPPQAKNIVCLVGTSQQDVFDAMYEADLYILNSINEGYGLVLLEAMFNCTPWIAYPTAAAFDLEKLGLGATYDNNKQLWHLLKHHLNDVTLEDITRNEHHVMRNHMIEDSVNSLLMVFQ